MPVGVSSGECALHGAGCELGCPIGPKEVRDNIRAMNDAISHPHQAIARLQTPPFHQVDLLAVSNVVHQSLAIREAGATALFIKLARDGYETTDSTDPDLSIQPSRHWESCIAGLINVLYVCSTEDARNDLRRRDLTQIRETYKDLVAIIWRDLVYLLHPGGSGEYRRETVARFLFICQGVIIDLKEEMASDETTLGLMMHCWVNRSERGRGSSVDLVWHLLDHAKPSSFDLAVRLVTVDTLAQKFQEWLSDPKLLDEPLRQDLHAISRIMMSDRPFVKGFLERKTHEHVLLAAAKRQRMKGKETCKEDVYLEVDYIYYALSMESTCVPVPLLASMVTADLLHFLNENSCVSVQQGDGSCPGMLRAVIHIADCKNALCPRNCQRKTAAFVAAIRAALLQTFLPICERLENLHQAAKTAKVKAQYMQILDAWLVLARLVSVTKEQCRTYGRETRRCRNAACPLSGVTHMDVKKCSRCRVATYCSPDCQRADWKVHKVECVALG